MRDLIASRGGLRADLRGGLYLKPREPQRFGTRQETAKKTSRSSGRRRRGAAIRGSNLRSTQLRLHRLVEAGSMMELRRSAAKQPTAVPDEALGVVEWLTSFLPSSTSFLPSKSR
ncbi:unnamed protein product [Cuscuta campestris]|uniref:Uncharacterized protein n=1 Tax=Cuscuta campestris TaxID=132261 RepID=A0A484KWP6_9ASTE|nr:unnamed protein product [Cuscuta campestris]